MQVDNSLLLYLETPLRFFFFNCGEKSLSVRCRQVERCLWTHKQYIYVKHDMKYLYCWSKSEQGLSRWSSRMFLRETSWGQTWRPWRRRLRSLELRISSVFIPQLPVLLPASLTGRSTGQLWSVSEIIFFTTWRHIIGESCQGRQWNGTHSEKFCSQLCLMLLTRKGEDYHMLPLGNVKPPDCIFLEIKCQGSCVTHSEDSAMCPHLHAWALFFCTIRETYMYVLWNNLSRFERNT